MRAEISLALLLLPAPAAAQSFMQSSSCRLEPGPGLNASLRKEGGEPVRIRLKRQPMASYVSEQCGLVSLVGGFNGTDMSINAVDVYSSTGGFLASTRVKMENMGGAGFNREGTLFMYAYQLRDTGGVSVFSMETGERLWNKPFPGKALEVKFSADGRLIVALTAAPWENDGRLFRVAAFSTEGKELWRDEFRSPYTPAFDTFEPDLRKFDIRVRHIRLGVPDGIKMKQMRKYRWDGSRLKRELIDYSADEHQPVKKKKGAEERQHGAGGDLDLTDAALEAGE